jgi:spore maturation protein CgeB
MQIISVFGEDHPLVAALVDAGCSLSKVPLWAAPIAKGPALYFGDAFRQVKRPIAFARLRSYLAQDRIPYVMWNRDAPWDCALKPWRKWLLRWGRPVDLHLAHSMQSRATFGDSAVYFPNAANTTNYHLGGRSLDSLRMPGAYRFDVSFIGTLNPAYAPARPRLQFLQALCARLQSLGISCQLFDTNPKAPLAAADQVEIIQASRINLSVGAVCDEPVPSWGLPERCFGVAACGGFLLCDRRKHAADTFTTEAWTDFGDLDECVNRIQGCLEDFGATRRRAELLHAEVLERHTYRHRAHQLLDLAQQWQLAAMPLRTQPVSP